MASFFYCGKTTRKISQELLLLNCFRPNRTSRVHYVSLVGYRIAVRDFSSPGANGTRGGWWEVPLVLWEIPLSTNKCVCGQYFECVGPIWPDSRWRATGVTPPPHPLSISHTLSLLPPLPVGILSPNSANFTPSLVRFSSSLSHTSRIVELPTCCTLNRGDAKHCLYSLYGQCLVSLYTCSLYNMKWYCNRTLNDQWSRCFFCWNIFYNIVRTGGWKSGIFNFTF